MSDLIPLSPRDQERSSDHIVVLHHVPWKTYEAVLAARGSGAAPRVTFLEGELEIMSPSHFHEAIAAMIDRLLTAWAEEMDADLNSLRSWTVKKRGRKRGGEADNCYILGPIPEPEPSKPHLVVEVEWTTGGLNKLDVWHGLGVREVWLWREGGFEVHLHAAKGYVRSKKSALLPELDLGQLSKFVRRRDQMQALREYRAMLKRH